MNPTGRAEALLCLIEERRAAVLKVLESGPVSPYSIAQELFPGSQRESLFRTVSDVMDHREMLEDAGLVTRRESKPLLFLKAV